MDGDKKEKYHGKLTLMARGQVTDKFIWLPSGKPFIFGRDTKCDIRIKTQQSLPFHGKIMVDLSGNAFLSFLGSEAELQEDPSRAILLNKVQRIETRRPVPLYHSDLFTIGNGTFLFENPKLVTPRQEPPPVPSPVPQQRNPDPVLVRNLDPKSTLELEESEDLAPTQNIDKAKEEDKMEEESESDEEEETSFASYQEQVRKNAAKINKTKTSLESKFYSQIVPSSAKRNNRK